MIDDFQCKLISILTQDKDIYRLIYSVLYLWIIITPRNIQNVITFLKS